MLCSYLGRDRMSLCVRIFSSGEMQVMKEAGSVGREWVDVRACVLVSRLRSTGIRRLTQDMYDNECDIVCERNGTARVLAVLWYLGHYNERKLH